ncbi:MAG: hypothetical protein ACI9XC_002706 [Gammaproteobacteria bacterium]
MQKSAVPVYGLRPEIPKVVSDIVNKAMAKTDANRYQSAAKFATDIKNVMNQLYPNSTLMETSKDYMLM